MTYSVTLIDCRGVAESSKRQAEGAFIQGLETALGGSDAVAPAFIAYRSAIERHGGESLPLDASAQDRDAVDRWNDAYGAGVESAFLGWVRSPEAAYFEIHLNA